MQLQLVKAFSSPSWDQQLRPSVPPLQTCILHFCSSLSVCTKGRDDDASDAWSWQLWSWSWGFLTPAVLVTTCWQQWNFLRCSSGSFLSHFLNYCLSYAWHFLSLPILWSCAKLSKITVKRVEIYCGRCDVIIMDSVVDIQFVKVKMKP